MQTCAVVFREVENRKTRIRFTQGHLGTQRTPSATVDNRADVGNKELRRLFFPVQFIEVDNSQTYYPVYSECYMV